MVVQYVLIGATKGEMLRAPSLSFKERQVGEFDLSIKTNIIFCGFFFIIIAWRLDHNRFLQKKGPSRTISS